MFGKISLFRNIDVVGEVLAEAKQLLNEQKEIIENQQEEIVRLKEDHNSKIDDLQKQISQLKEQIDKTEKPRVNPAPYVFEYNPSTVCPKCGISWEGTMGYSCPDSHCPIQPNTSTLTNYTLHNDYDDMRARRDNMSSPGNKDYKD